MDKLEIIQKNSDHFSIKGFRHLNMETILYSGQYHLWQEGEDGYFIVEHNGLKTAIRSTGEVLEFLYTTESEILNHWLPWLDYTTDYEEMGRALSFDPYCAQAFKENPGLRILRQSPYEASLQFIMSANNNMPRMMKAFQQMSTYYGEDGPEIFGHAQKLLPTADVLGQLDPLVLRDTAKVGYRDQALVGLGQDISIGEFSVEYAKQLEDEKLFIYLQTLKGVGPKVAQCIMLYGYHRMASFPIDVWIKRIMVKLYSLEGKSNKFIAEFAQNRFGAYAGFAQQLLFMYARTHREIFDKTCILPKDGVE